MRASLQEVAAVMESSRVPKKITQEPFDYEPGHYTRLCDLRNNQPSDRDLIDYALDMTYMVLQPDLLRHLMPVLLNAWRRDLFEGGAAGFGGFVEHFWPALLKGEALRANFSDAERAVVMRFMRDTILDRLDVEDSLAFEGSGASPYEWVGAFVSFGVLFPDIESLWTEWWQMKTSGHAVAAFQYASALLYEDDKNPVFAPWTREKGGGPPAVWECGCHLYDVGWREENLHFLRRTLSVEYIEQRLRTAQGVITNAAAKAIASRIVGDLPTQASLLSLRIEQLPAILTNLSDTDGFTISGKSE
ncbi:MAG: hypothetical protein HZA88_04285 [Verrucomicrobia bacterium]|nr:hypothetical protein [Verrucomicrobiota bacterium]